MPSPHRADLDQAWAILRDPRTDLGMTTRDHACKIRTVIRGLLMELQWQQLRDATERDNPSAIETEYHRRLAVVHAIHVAVPSTDDRIRCGSCAEVWPCRTTRAALGERKADR